MDRSLVSPLSVFRELAGSLFFVTQRDYSNIFLDFLILSGAWLSPSLLSLIDECWDFVLSRDAHPQGTTRKVFVSLLVFAIDKCHL